jgi:hypothetical protein
MRGCGETWSLNSSFLVDESGTDILNPGGKIPNFFSVSGLNLELVISIPGGRI